MATLLYCCSPSSTPRCFNSFVSLPTKRIFPTKPLAFRKFFYGRSLPLISNGDAKTIQFPSVYSCVNRREIEITINKLIFLEFILKRVLTGSEKIEPKIGHFYGPTFLSSADCPITGRGFGEYLYYIYLQSIMIVWFSNEWFDYRSSRTATSGSFYPGQRIFSKQRQKQERRISKIR